MADYIPTTEGELLAWSQNLSAHIAASPERFALSVEQARDYQSLHDAFEQAYDKAASPATRTTVAVAEKRDAKARLVGMARQIGRWIQAQPATTDAMRMTLGLAIAKARPQRIGPPSERPALRVERVSERAVTFRLHRSDGRCAKPEGVKYASVFAYNGDQPPRDLGEWRLLGMISRASGECDGSALRAGGNVWLCACWHNPRGEAGPASEPVALLGGVHVLRIAA